MVAAVSGFGISVYSLVALLGGLILLAGGAAASRDS